MIDQIQQRLPDCEELSAFTIFDPQKVPSQTEESEREAFQQWGSDQLAILERMYAEGDNPDICKEAIQSEWASLKHMFSSTYKNLTMQGMLKLLVSNATLKSMYPQSSKLVSISLVIPVSTAECERCFSAMKRIKTDLRNHLLTSTLRNLMRISTEGPLLQDYDFDQAVDIWSGKRQRRITV